MTERKLAVIKRIDEITPIPDADAIECARVGGWRVVVKKGEYQENQLAVFCEVDSFVPTTLAPFLTKAGHFPKEYEGIQGERLRTVRLRGQLSQGLLLPIDVLLSQPLCATLSEEDFIEGGDVTELLGIIKWERPELAGTCSNAKGNFPHFLRKTDQERCQNLSREIAERKGESFEVTIKIDGSSITCFHFNGAGGVCSRNIELKEDEGNAFWDIARKEHLLEKIAGRNIAVQGELIAPNIQSNYEKVTKPEFYCFSIFDIDKQEYLLPSERIALCKDLGIPHVKVFDSNFVLDHTVDELLAMAEGEGMKPQVKREGLVFKSNTNGFSFKAISNSYLLKEK
jgi:RNA ligase (TIGR02306 family)